MNKIITLVTMLCFSIISKAQQIPAGTTLLGGTIGFGRSTQQVPGRDDTHNSNISISPAIGKFYRDGRVAGINLNYSNNKSTDNSSEGNYYGLGIFLRQYLPIGKSFYVFAEENISGQTGKYSQKYDFGETLIDGRRTAVTLNIYPGIAFAISRRFQAELSITDILSLGYTIEKRDEANSGTVVRSNTRNISLAAGATSSSLGSLSVGTKWFLSK